MEGNESLEEVRVELGENSYSIIIGNDILSGLGAALKELPIGEKIMVVTNPTVQELYGDITIRSLENAGFQVVMGIVPDGEQYKSMASAQALYDTAFAAGLDRKSAVLALGGGVIGDLAGFVAATYMRGVPFVQVPTTLLAQVDSSVGGKVAVNHPKGKNIIGSFYQPKLVYADINTLRTLDERQFRAGMAEVIKYGVIWDAGFFSYLEENLHKIKGMQNETLVKIVRRSCEIKAHVVEQDEKESGIRAILNYGHTFGHAIEALTNYSVFVHGEAVAIGMVTANRLAQRLGLLSQADLDRIGLLIAKTGLPVDCGNINKQAMLRKMYFDKKVQSGRIKYILPEKIGRVRITDAVDESDVLAVL
ncbi:3-dehydroquinate synthase [Thermincola potens]|uniref:3-dehydroquinate synthase n=1 Tax=Thermincola potens (strain JR) TaxID=635013 RepID=D5X7L9_THEPJ|nr:3-dehydroquinate synthase [Thermincola potens]ADG82589.1 3-dehydroquinate synthase [Thermincola potens JR]